jgi:hypothetical protein
MKRKKAVVAEHLIENVGGDLRCSKKNHAFFNWTIEEEGGQTRKEQAQRTLQLSTSRKKAGEFA